MSNRASPLPTGQPPTVRWKRIAVVKMDLWRQMLGVPDVLGREVGGGAGPVADGLLGAIGSAAVVAANLELGPDEIFSSVTSVTC